jgi:WD40 repeat protein
LVNAIDINADGTQALSGGLDGRVLLWDLTTGEQLLEMAGHADAVNAVAFNAAGDRAASGAGDDTVIVWGLPDGEQITQHATAPT